MRGSPRGKIRPWDGRLISIRVELGQVGRTSSAFVMRNRSRAPGCAGVPGLSSGTPSKIGSGGERRYRSGLR
jgi:hypothetical protein